MPRLGDRFNPNRLFSGVFIPEPILQLRSLAPGAKIVYARLMRYAGERCEVYPAISTLSAEVGMGETQAREYIGQLVEVGLIEKEPRPGETNLYYFLWHDCFDTGASDPRNRILPLRDPGALPLRDPDTPTPPGSRRGTPPGSRRPPLRDPGDEEKNEEKTLKTELHPPISPPGEGTPISEKTVLLLKRRLKALRKFGSVNKSVERYLAQAVEAWGGGFTEEELLAAVEDFGNQDYWHQFENKAAAFVRHMANEGWRDRVAVEGVDPPLPTAEAGAPVPGAAAASSAPIVATAINAMSPADVVATWERVVGEQVNWSKAHDPTVVLLRLCGVPEFVDNLEAICANAKQARDRRGPDVAWLTFRWLIAKPKADKSPNWWNLLMKPESYTRSFGDESPRPAAVTPGDQSVTSRYAALRAKHAEMLKKLRPEGGVNG